MTEQNTKVSERHGPSRGSDVSSARPKRKPGAAGRGKPEKGRQQKGRRKKAGPPPALAKKAAEIAERTGLSQKDALRVASGKVTVQKVLKEMLVREKLKVLIGRGELNPMYVPAIVAGQMPLERAKFLTRLLDDESWRSTQSIFEDLVESGKARVFFLFGREPFAAKVPKISKYDVWFQREDGDEVEQTEKHNVILSCETEELDELLAARSVDESVAAKALGPSVSYKDRFRSDKEVFYKHSLSQEPIRVTFRDGMVVTGRVGWFGRWEFQLKLSETCQPVVFRHAMYSLEAV